MNTQILSDLKRLEHKLREVRTFRGARDYQRANVAADDARLLAAQLVYPIQTLLDDLRFLLLQSQQHLIDLDFPKYEFAETAAITVVSQMIDRLKIALLSPHPPRDCI